MSAAYRLLADRPRPPHLPAATDTGYRCRRPRDGRDDPMTPRGLGVRSTSRATPATTLIASSVLAWLVPATVPNTRSIECMYEVVPGATDKCYTPSNKWL